MTKWPDPPAGFETALLDAARVARLGVSISSSEGPLAQTLWANEIAMEILGRPFSDLASTSALDFLAPEELPRVGAWAAARRAGEITDPTLETVILRPDGTRLPIEVSASRLHLGGRPLTVTFFQDIRSRRAAADALRRSEAQLRLLIESAPDAVVIAKEGRIAFANRAAAALVGVTEPSELLGVRTGDFFLPGDAEDVDGRIRRVLERGEPEGPREYRARRRSGQELVVEVSSHALEYDGAPAVLAFGRDVTERVRAQAELARENRLAALGTLSAGIAHEINNPLAYVVLGIQALENELRSAIVDPAARERALARLEPLRSGTARVADIVKDLLAFSREEHGAPGPVRLADVAAAAERLALHELRHHATLDMQIDAEAWVLGHAGRLEQVLLNLLVNASQALQGRTDGRITVRCTAGDPWVELSVADDGAGIAPEHLPRVFDPFFTTKAAGLGTGLGLSICHGLITQMGGEMDIESELGRGTTVRLRLRPGARSDPAAQEAPEAVPSRRLRVLVADDEPSLRRALRALLEADHDVEAVGGGEELLERLAEGALPDVVLCDLMMPGVGGAEVFARVRRDRPELAPRFVFMTGGAVTPRAMSFLAELANTCLLKPFSASALLVALREASEAGHRSAAA